MAETRACKFYVERKRRFCKFEALKDSNFCGQHLTPDSAGQIIMNEKKRIPCPLDPKHTVFEDKLEKHLKKCNSRHIEHEFSSPDLHSGEGDEPEQCSLAAVSLEKVEELVKMITHITDTEITTSCDIREHKLLHDAIQNPEHRKSLKHRKQEASLLAHISERGWLDDDVILLEMGAGRAKFSCHVLELIKDKNGCCLVIVDRYHTRGKCENKYKGLDGPDIVRIQIDIKNLDLEKLSVLSNSENINKPIITYSKHLCGAATDLTLRCVQCYMKDNQETTRSDGTKKPKQERRLEGILVALCCHHRCTWRSYVGKEFWRRNGLTSADFAIIKSLTGWATCAFPNKQTDEVLVEEDEHVSTNEQIHGKFDIWSNAEKERIGIQAKRLIDCGRSDFIKNSGYNVQFIEYVDKKTSLENVMLLATKS